MLPCEGVHGLKQHANLPSSDRKAQLGREARYGFGQKHQ
jgi:hypothetical protein